MKQKLALVLKVFPFKNCDKIQFSISFFCTEKLLIEMI